MSDRACFQQLKAAVESRFRSRHPACTRPIHAWKGQDIIDFQEDLARVVKGRISEKWFYTHMKGNQDKLPRIDMLNMLSAYVGAASWDAFRHGIEPASPQPATAPDGKRPNWKVAGWALGIAATVGLFALIFVAMASKTTYTFCFVDEVQGTAISDSGIVVTLLVDGESPIQQKAGPDGCYRLETEAKTVRFVVQAPYYHPDTVSRALNADKTKENIPLRTDDYALMIHLFSTAKVEDWKKRKTQLEMMIADEAQIFQLEPGGEVGMEMFNKEEFILKMTMPLKSLRNIEILETQYDRHDRIKGMRFIQTEQP